MKPFGHGPTALESEITFSKHSAENLMIYGALKQRAPDRIDGSLSPIGSLSRAPFLYLPFTVASSNFVKFHHRARTFITYEGLAE